MKVKADLQGRALKGTAIKTPELTGLALDWAVALAEDIEPGTEGHYSEDEGRSVITRLYFQAAEMVDDTYSPSTIWAHGGPIIQREAHNLFKHNGGTDWCAAVNVPREGYTAIVTADGPTPLIAAMRCFCYSKLGDVVDIPEELCQQQSS